MGEPKPWARPRRWWSVLGGLCTITTFTTVVAGNRLGTQTVLLGLLFGQLTTALIVDIVTGKLDLSSWPRFLGFAVVLVSIAFNSCTSGIGGQPFWRQLDLEL